MARHPLVSPGNALAVLAAVLGLGILGVPSSQACPAPDGEDVYVTPLEQTAVVGTRVELRVEVSYCEQPPDLVYLDIRGPHPALVPMAYNGGLYTYIGVLSGRDSVDVHAHFSYVSVKGESVEYWLDRGGGFVDWVGSMPDPLEQGQFEPPPLETGETATGFEVLATQRLAGFDFGLVRYEEEDRCWEIQPAWKPGVVSLAGGGLCGDASLAPGEHVAPGVVNFLIEYAPIGANVGEPPLPISFIGIGGPVSDEVEQLVIQWTNGQVSSLNPTNGVLFSVTPGTLMPATVTALDSAHSVLQTLEICPPPDSPVPLVAEQCAILEAALE